MLKWNIVEGASAMVPVTVTCLSVCVQSLLQSSTRSSRMPDTMCVRLSGMVFRSSPPSLPLLPAPQSRGRARPSGSSPLDWSSSTFLPSVHRTVSEEAPPTAAMHPPPPPRMRSRAGACDWWPSLILFFFVPFHQHVQRTQFQPGERHADAHQDLPQVLREGG